MKDLRCLRGNHGLKAFEASPGREVGDGHIDQLRHPPQLSRLAFLWNRNNASHLAYLDEWRAAVPKVGAQPLFIEVSRDEEFEPAFEKMVQERADALSITADPFHLSHVAWIIDFVAKHRLPTMYVLKENVVAGGAHVIWTQHPRSLSARCWLCA